MKIKYEKPYLEEIELVLEGSFLDSKTDPNNPKEPGVDVGDGEGGGDGDDTYWN